MIYIKIQSVIIINLISRSVEICRKTMSTIQIYINYIKTALAKQVYFTAFYFFLLIFTAVQPMLWGMVPFWHRGDVPTSHKLTTNNARLEGKKNSSTILEKSQFK